MTQYIDVARIQSFDNADMSKPFVIETEMQKWPATEKWTFNYFKEVFGDIPIHVFRSNSDLNVRKDHTTMTLGEYIDYILTTEDKNPYYLVDWFVYQNLPEIVKDYSTPKPFVSWLSYLPYKMMPKFLSLYIGPKGSMSQLHIDIVNTAAWNACLQGTKEWLFFPPSAKEYLYDSQVNAFNPDHEKFPEFEKAQGYQLIQKAGDLIYTPSGWWHTVRNIEPSIALTDNFLNEQNIKRFFTHLIPGINHLLMRTWKRRGTARNRDVEIN